MEKLDREFNCLMQSHSVEDLNALSGAVYGVWANFHLGYLNPAWFHFAQENNGEPHISNEWGLGRSILDCVSGEVKRIFSARFNECLDTNSVWDHEYECSSATHYRRYHQIVYPLGHRDGLLIVNSLVMERPQVQKATSTLDESLYMNENSYISQCAHCRRVKCIGDSERWDWIPKWVRQCPEHTSHTFCPTCFAHYYPLPTTRERQSKFDIAE